MPKMPCVTQSRPFSQSSILKLSGLKRSCLSYSRLHFTFHIFSIFIFHYSFHIFSPKRWILYGRGLRTFANQLPTLDHKEQESTTSKSCPIWVFQQELEKWVCKCSGHLTFPLYCYELKSGNSALNPTIGSVFFFLTSIFQSCYSKVGQVLVCKIHNFNLFTSRNHG